MPSQILPLVFVLGDMVRPKQGHRLVFAYDLLMDEAEARLSCPAARLISKARVLNRQFVVNSQGAVTTVRRSGLHVRGIVWEIPEPEVVRLEERLDFPGSVDRVGAFARNSKGGLIAVEFYCPFNHRHGEADPKLVVRLMALANRYRFPDEYQQEIANWGPGLVDDYGPPRLVE